MSHLKNYHLLLGSGNYQFRRKRMPQVCSGQFCWTALTLRSGVISKLVLNHQQGRNTTIFHKETENLGVNSF